MFDSIHKNHPFLKGLSYTVVLVVGILLAVFLLAKSITEFKYGSEREYLDRTITVSGVGEVTAIPDVAIFTFDVSERADTAEAAQTIATEKINKISKLLNDSGVKEEDINTLSYNIYPRYKWVESSLCKEKFDCKDKEQIISGYEVSQSTKVKIKDIDLASELIVKVGVLGVSYISGLQFVIDEDKDFQEEARDLAIQDAKEKASKRAKSLGVKLGDLVSFYEESNGGYPQPMYAESFSLKADFASPTLSPGEEEVVSRVSIIFEIK